MTSINTNMNAITALNQLRITGDNLATSLERLSTGLRVNHGSDDPAGIGVGVNLQSKISGDNAAIQNAQTTKSMITIAEGGLNEASNILMRIRDLSIKGANVAALSYTDMTNIAVEVISLKNELTRQASAATFNGKTLLDGSFATAAIQVGPDNTAANTFQFVTIATASSLLAMNTAIIAPSSAPVSTTFSSMCRTMITAASDSLTGVSNARAALGIVGKRIDSVINNLNTDAINNSSAMSQIMDADMAAEISNMTRSQILQQTGTAMLAQANAAVTSLLSLLK